MSSPNGPPRNGVYPPGPAGDWRDAGNPQIAHSINRLDQRLDQLITHGRITGITRSQRTSPIPRYRAGYYAPPPNGHYPPPPNASWSSGIDQAVAEMSARQRALEIDPEARASGAAAGRLRLSIAPTATRRYTPPA